MPLVVSRIFCFVFHKFFSAAFRWMFHNISSIRKTSWVEPTDNTQKLALNGLVLRRSKRKCFWLVRSGILIHLEIIRVIELLHRIWLHTVYGLTSMGGGFFFRFTRNPKNGMSLRANELHSSSVPISHQSTAARWSILQTSPQENAETRLFNLLITTDARAQK